MNVLVHTRSVYTSACVECAQTHTRWLHDDCSTETTSRKQNFSQPCEPQDGSRAALPAHCRPAGWLIEPQELQPLRQTGEIKTAEPVVLTPHYRRRAVAHPLRQPLGMHTHFQVKDKWRRWQVRTCPTEEMWRSDMLLRSSQVGSLRLCSDRLFFPLSILPSFLFFFLLVPSPQTFRQRNQWSEFDWLVGSAVVKAGNPRLNQSI